MNDESQYWKDEKRSGICALSLKRWSENYLFKVYKQCNHYHGN